MKVALVTHTLLKGGGQARVNFELARHLMAAGVHVTAIAQRVAEELLDAGLHWRKIDVWPLRPYLISDHAFARAAEHVVRDIGESFDAVIANGFVLTGAPHAINISHFVHGAWRQSPFHTARVCGGVYSRYHAFYSWCNARWERRAYDAAETVVAVSQKVREELIGIGVSPRKIRVIVNGVDLDEFQPGPVNRSLLGLPVNAPLALFVGDIRGPRKNLDGVLRAMVEVKDAHLAVVGETKNSPYPAEAARLGLGDRVRFLGYRRDVPDLMRAADLFVFPSRYEACSLALLESLASGLPVITARTTGGSELVDSSCGRVLEDAEDLHGLTSALRQLTENIAERDRLSLGARRRAEQCGWSRMASQYIELLRERAAITASPGSTVSRSLKPAFA